MAMPDATLCVTLAPASQCAGSADPAAAVVTDPSFRNPPLRSLALHAPTVGDCEPSIIERAYLHVTCTAYMLNEAPIWVMHTRIARVRGAEVRECAADERDTRTAAHAHVAARLRRPCGRSAARTPAPAPAHARRGCGARPAEWTARRAWPRANWSLVRAQRHDVQSYTDACRSTNPSPLFAWPHAAYLWHAHPVTHQSHARCRARATPKRTCTRRR